MTRGTKRALVIGHFSTIGDTESLEIVSQWLDRASIPHDAAPFSDAARKALAGCVDYRRVDPVDYSHLVMICGPAWEGHFESIRLDLSRFGHCVRIGVNLTMVAPLGEWNPFDALIERDSDRTARPDLTLLRETRPVPVVGRCIIRKQDEYGDRQRHDRVRELFDDLIERRNFAVIEIDTRRSARDRAPRAPEHVLSVLKRVDLLLTNRLHGLVYGLKAGVPVLAIDGIEGGAKVSTQARTLGWPACVPVEEATRERLEEALDWCLSDDARTAALACREAALPALRDVEREFLAAVTADITPRPLPPTAGQSAGFFSRFLRSDR